MRRVAADTQWAQQMAEQEISELRRYMGIVQNRVNGYKEFAAEAGCTLSADTIREATDTVEALRDLVMEWSA